MSKEENKTALLDTGFIIRLLKEDDVLHNNALNYFRYFLGNNIICKISTIAIAEYCVKGNLDEIPIKNLQVIPFTITHASEAGQLCNCAYTLRQQEILEVTPRIVIPNDTKMFAQANVEKISYFVSADSKADSLYKKLHHHYGMNFAFVDIHKPYNEYFGLLPLD